MNNMTYTVKQMDCVDYLMSVPDNTVDVIFTDPPYNTGNTEDKTITYDRNADFAAKKWTNFHSDWDTIDNYLEWVMQWGYHARRILKPTGSIFVCGSFHSIPETAIAFKALGFYTIQWIQWCIPNAFPNLQGTKLTNANQTIIWARPRQNKTQHYDKEAAKRYNDGVNLKDYWIIPKESKRKSSNTPWLYHPSKKPVALAERAIDIALPKIDGVIVLDFFAGSGSTGEAVKNIARRYSIDIQCLLVDKDKEYVDGIEARMRSLTKEGK